MLLMQGIASCLQAIGIMLLYMCTAAVSLVSMQFTYSLCATSE